MPLSTTRVIPPGWSEHHRPTAEGQMTATGRIQIPASRKDGTFDEDAGRLMPAAPTTIYTGDLRVQRLPVGTTVQSVEVAGREVIMRSYRVAVPVDGPSQPVPIGAIVIVDTCPDDPAIVGRPLRVREVPTSTLAWQRDLFCEDAGPTTR